MVGLDGEDGLHVQSAVGVDPDPDPDHVTIQHHNTVETAVQKVQMRIMTATFILVPVSSK